MIKILLLKKQKLKTYNGDSFGGSVHYHHAGKHGGLQADTVLKRELRFLRLDLKAARKRLSLQHWAEFDYRTSKPIPTVIYFLRQGHTYSNKDAPPNSVTPCGPGIPTHMSP